MSSLFLRPDLALAPHEVGEVVTLSGDEARHAVTVNRLRVGEHTALGDGNGLVVHGVVVRVEGKELDIAVERSEVHEAPSPRLVLVQALAKGDRDELAIQAATELGVAAVVPWQAERSVSRWNEQKAAKGVERWTTIVREAAKQSIRPFVPAVGDLVDTGELAALARECAGAGEGRRMLLLEPSAETRLTEVALEPLGGASTGAGHGTATGTATGPAAPGTATGTTPAEPTVFLVVGPEGGISPRELEQLGEAGAVAVRLGDEVLRTSTAGPAALAVLNAAFGRW
ncbi:16S rRNA (uracil(1498)-N(3))-methyltransferase [Herbiconiux sp. A18JL235]|uniref:Ribosomal RNA small subunit methyltransferase E n=1 Tax=Herbiconiux sp. A18JL235 TaxID=3152363 RepID=A0AB39BCN7_9MICO